jgi:hypothetical protein
MNPQIFVLVLAVGAGALAIWTDVRFPKLAPESMGGVLLHTVAAMIVLQVVASTIGGLTSGPFPTPIAAVLGVALPGLLYAFISGVWAIRLFQGAYAGSR